MSIFMSGRVSFTHCSASKNGHGAYILREGRNNLIKPLTIAPAVCIIPLVLEREQ